MPRDIETKITFKGEDDITHLQDEIERGTDKVYDNLAKTNKLSGEQISLWEKLKRTITGVNREIEKGQRLGGVYVGRGRAGAEALGIIPRRPAGGGPGGPGGPTDPFQRVSQEIAGPTAKEQERQRRKEEREAQQRGRQEQHRREQSEIRWRSFATQAPARAMNLATGGIGAVEEGGGMLAGLVSKLGLPGKIAAGIIATAGAGAMVANRLAQPAIQALPLQVPLRIRHGRAAEEAIRAQGAAAGIMPMEALQQFTQMERFGGQAGFQPMTQLRGVGVEPEQAIGAFAAATAGGGVLGRTTREYEQFAKLIAAAIADKTKLPSVPQYLDQMTGLLQTSNQYAGDLTESGLEMVAGIAKWQETAGTSLLRGTRGTQTMASLTNWVARTEDPAAQAMIYQSLKSSPYFMAKAGEYFGTGKGGLGLDISGPGKEYKWLQFARSGRLAPLAAITAMGRSAAFFGGDEAMAAMMMGKQWGMSPEQALTLQRLGGAAREKLAGGMPENKVNDFINEEFKKGTGANLADVLSGNEELALQRQMSATANAQLEQATKLLPAVTAMKEELTRFVEAALPFITVASNIAGAGLWGVRKLIVEPLVDEERFRDQTSKIIAGEFPEAATGGY